MLGFARRLTAAEKAQPLVAAKWGQGGGPQVSPERDRVVALVLTRSSLTACVVLVQTVLSAITSLGGDFQEVPSVGAHCARLVKAIEAAFDPSIGNGQTNGERKLCSLCTSSADGVLILRRVTTIPAA